MRMTYNCYVDSINQIAHRLTEVKQTNPLTLQMPKMNQRQENLKKQCKDGAGCSSDIYQLLLHKSALLEDLAENKYDFDHNQYRWKKELSQWDCPDGFQAC